MSDREECVEVPLIEKLRSVPKDYRTCVAIQWASDGTETGHQFIPVGYMMHEAADAIASMQAKLDDLEHDRNGAIEQWLEDKEISGKKIVAQQARIEGLRGALADFAYSYDMSIQTVRHKAERIYKSVMDDLSALAEHDKAVRKEVLERAAALCAANGEEPNNTMSEYADGYDKACCDCANLILSTAEQINKMTTKGE